MTIYRFRSGDELPASHLQSIGQVRASLGLDAGGPPHTAVARCSSPSIAASPGSKTRSSRLPCVVKSHFDRNSLAAVWASTNGWPVMLAETSINRNTRISSGAAARGRVSRRQAQPGEIVGNGLDHHRQPVAGVALDGLHLHDAV